MRLYWKLVGARIRAQMQYKVSFALEVIGFLLLTGLEFAVAVIILNRFRSVGGWRLEEIALLYGMASTCFGVANMVGRGFDSPFERMIRQGKFDVVMLRPLGSFFQVLASEFQLRQLGRMLQGLIVLGYALTNAPIRWTWANVLLLLLALISGTVIYTAVIVLSAAICFWTIKMPEMVNAFTGGGVELSSYPLGIYNGWLRAVFLFVVPVAFGNYPAALALLGRADPGGLPVAAAWLAPLVALLFFGFAWRCFQFGVSKYQSAGS